MKKHTLAIVLTTAALALGSCSADEPPPDPAAAPASTQEPASISFEAPGKDELARGVQLGDQTSQELYDVAADGDHAVAVGYEQSANQAHPLVVTSADAGRTWTRAVLPMAEDAAGGYASADVVAAGPGGFVVGIEENGLPTLLSSPDGLEWSRTDLPEGTFTRQDSLAALRHYGDTWYLVGTNSVPKRRATQRIMLWTSTDGVSWNRSDLSAKGVRAIGTPSVADVAVFRGKVVLAGGIQDADQVQQPDRLAIWESADGGASFTQQATPSDLGGDYRAYSEQLLVHEHELLLAAKGDGSGDGWDGVVLTQHRGGWTKTAPVPFSTSQEDAPTTLVGQGDTLVMAGGTDEDPQDAAVASGSSPAGLVGAWDRSLTAKGVQWISSGAMAAGRTILVGSTSVSGSTEAAVWTVAKGRVRTISLPQEIHGGRPSTYVSSVIKEGDRFVAVGSASDSPVVWTSTDFATWEARGLSGRSRDITAAGATTLASLGSGRLLVVGGLGADLGGRAGVWRGSTRSWERLTPDAFDVSTKSGYNSVWGQAIAVRGRRVVVAAGASVNNSAEVRPMLSTDRGRTWRAATGSGLVPLSETDLYMRRTPYLGFRAPTNGEVGVNDATATRRGFVMSGYTQPSGEGARGVVWRSRSGEHWTAPRTLPMPAKGHSVYADEFVASGRRLVLSGLYYETAESADAGWLSWVSENGGRSWELGSVVTPKEGVVLSLVAIPGGFLALGNTGPSGDTDAAAWTSTDGRRWAPVDLGLERAGGPGVQSLVDAVVDGDELRLIANDVPPEGGGYFAQTVPLPRA